MGSKTRLHDPQEVLRVFLEGPDSASIQQTDRLWRFCVDQCALADVGVAVGDAPTAWQDGWRAFEHSVRDLMAKSIPDETISTTLNEYAVAARNAIVLQAFGPLAERLETLLKRQRLLLAFHFDKEENAYRRREAVLSERLSVTHATPESRLSLAREILDELGRYEAIFVPHLRDVSKSRDSWISVHWLMILMVLRSQPKTCDVG